MLEDFNASTFKELEDKRFQVGLNENASLNLELARIDDLPSSARQERFSLFFTGPLDPFLPQGTYKMEHSQLGSFELFLVPVARDEDGFSYEAAFNR